MRSLPEWLRQIGLENYAEVFAANGVDFETLGLLTEEDLTRLGVLLGHRRKLLKALAELGDNAVLALPPSPVEPVEPVDQEATSQAERRHLSVMFCDLVGSTELSRKLDPEELRDLLQAYQRACGEVIARYEGHVAQYLGDGLMVYFGWPRAHEDDPVRAIHAGLEVAQAVLNLNASTPVSARIGIHTGLVVVGETGQGDASIPKAAVGDTPNIAARLQALAEPNCVVVSESTHSLARGMFDYRDLGLHPLKGMAEPVQLFQVVAPRPIESRFQASRDAVPLTPMVGREEEIALLLRRWRQGSEGEGQVVVLGGEPGIGKSRLTHVVSERVGHDRHRVLRFQCSPFHSHSALYPAIEHFERAAGFDREDTAEQKLDKVLAVLARAEQRVAESAALFAALLSLPIERYGPLEHSSEQQKEKTLEALADYVESLAQRDPLLLIYEDVQWIDATSQEWLDLLVPRLRNLPVLLIVTYRPEYAPRWGDQAHVTLLSLIRLGRREGEELAGKVTGGKPLPQEVLDQILRHTDGVPLFIEELTKSVLESALLREEAHRYTLQSALPALAIPSTLRDSLRARLERLAPVREVAQTGACIGRDFAYELLALVCSLEGAELDDALEQLIKTGLISRRGTPPDSVYKFKHALVQDVAYDSLLKSKRQQLHAAIARAIERHFPAQAKSEPYLLAHHCTEGGMFEEAVRYWNLAAQRASAQFAITEAIVHARRGLATLGKLSGSAKTIQQELALRVGLSASLRIADRYDEALAELDRAESLAAQGELSADLARIHHSRGNIYFPLGKIDQCLVEHQFALQFARQAQSTEDEARALGGIGDAFYMSGRFRSAHKQIEQCIELCREHAFHDIETAYLPVRASTYMYALQFEEALGDVRSAISMAGKSGQPWAEIIARSTSTFIFLDRHEFALANEHAQRTRELVDKMGARRFGPLCNHVIAYTRLHNGDRAGALELLEASLMICRETGIAFWGPIVLGLISLASTDALRRQEALSEGEAILNEGCVSHTYFWFYRDAIEVSLGERDWDRADRYANALEAYFGDEPSAWSDFIVARGRTLAELGRGKRGNAVISRIRDLHAVATRLRMKSELKGLTEALQLQRT
jgi:class 3 adenylate cyclase/tetratricopeptide (TPR) repeat protein